MPRPKLVPIAAARPRTKKPMSGKENVVAHKQYPPSSSSASPVAAVRSRRERPCDACRRRKSRCVIHEGASLCVLCEFHKQDCTFVESPQPRKRKLPAEPPKNDEALKKRYVSLLSIPPSPHFSLFSNSLSSPRTALLLPLLLPNAADAADANNAAALRAPFFFSFMRLTDSTPISAFHCFFYCSDLVPGVLAHPRP